MLPEEVYVTRYPDLGSKLTVSTEGGTYPRWARDMSELFYRQGDAMMAVRVDTSRGLRADRPGRLFAGAFAGVGGEGAFDVSPDGQRFVMIKSDETATLTRITLVQNLLP